MRSLDIIIVLNEHLDEIICQVVYVKEWGAVFVICKLQTLSYPWMP
jgi:hypothetical protein